jgi:hypothetical protein
LKATLSAGWGFTYRLVVMPTNKWKFLLIGGRFGCVGHLPAILDGKGLLLALILCGVEGRNISSDDRHAWRLWKRSSCCFLKMKRKGTERIIGFIRKLMLVLGLRLNKMKRKKRKSYTYLTE